MSFETRQRHVQLFEAAAENQGQQAPERPKDGGPFGPAVHLVFGGPLVEGGYSRMDRFAIEHSGKAGDQPPWRIFGQDFETRSRRVIVKEARANAARRSCWTTKPGVFGKLKPAPHRSHPLLGYPIRYKPALCAQPDHCPRLQHYCRSHAPPGSHPVERCLLGGGMRRFEKPSADFSTEARSSKGSQDASHGPCSGTIRQ